MVVLYSSMRLYISLFCRRIYVVGSSGSSSTYYLVRFVLFADHEMYHAVSYSKRTVVVSGTNGLLCYVHSTTKNILELAPSSEHDGIPN